MDEVKFYPGKLLQSIVHIYINLKDESSFVHAIPRDGRSYHPSLFKETAVKLCKLYVPEDVITDLLKVGDIFNYSNIEHIYNSSNVRIDGC